MAKKRTARRIRPARREAFITAAMSILRKGKPTVFRFEAALRNGLRSRFCSEGWHWQDAHDAAEDITLTALGRLGAVRPTLQQGQSDYVRDGAAFTTILRTRCANCGAPLEGDQWRFCSKLCADVTRKRLDAVAKSQDERILKEINNAA